MGPVCTSSAAVLVSEITESQNVWGWKEPLGVIYSKPRAEAGSPRAGCREPCPGGF